MVSLPTFSSGEPVKISPIVQYYIYYLDTNNKDILREIYIRRKIRSLIRHKHGAY